MPKSFCYTEIDKMLSNEGADCPTWELRGATDELCVDEMRKAGAL
jgi:hypothetical protein